MTRAALRSTAVAAFALACALPACGTIFPRYHTATRPAPAGMLESGGLESAPTDMRELTFVSADLPPSRTDGSRWDGSDDPDLYVLLTRDGEEIYRTPVVENTLHPVWNNASVTLRFAPHARYRVEVRDDDGAVSEYVAGQDFVGEPEGAAGGNVLFQLPRGVVLRVRASAPTPTLGMGVEYEIHETFVHVLALDEVCPARTAGLRVDDHITAVDGRSVGDLGEIGARQAMDRAAIRDVSLRVERTGRPPFVVDVRLNAVYRAR